MTPAPGVRALAEATERDRLVEAVRLARTYRTVPTGYQVGGHGITPHFGEQEYEDAKHDDELTFRFHYDPTGQRRADVIYTAPKWCIGLMLTAVEDWSEYDTAVRTLRAYDAALLSPAPDGGGAT